jgi:hypothetical protein
MGATHCMTVGVECGGGTFLACRFLSRFIALCIQIRGLTDSTWLFNVWLRPVIHFLLLERTGPLSKALIALKAYNGQYLSAEGGGGREIIANRAIKTIFETFEIEHLGNSNVAIKAPSGHYFCAESGGGREVVANGNTRGPREIFTLSTFDYCCRSDWKLLSAGTSLMNFTITRNPNARAVELKLINSAGVGGPPRVFPIVFPPLL